MLNKINISPKKQIMIVYIVLIVVTLAVFWQVNQHDFINLDDNVYVTENSNIQSGITLDGLRWAFSTTYAEFWHPLTWLSLMLDYQLFGLNAGGYHLTNLILHIMSALLLFWLFNRMTGSIWRSAFVAALFALHPLHVESVAWIAERKDVLSAFFWMLTLCLYVYYTEKPVIKRYLLVLLCFVCGLMSKTMVVTLPIVMILLDYWPLDRLGSQKKGNISPSHDQKLPGTKIMGIIPSWQLREKIPFFIFSAFFSIITLYAQYNPSAQRFSLGSRIANAPVSFVAYLGKTFWPQDLTVLYPFSDQLPVWQILGAALLIIVISIAVIAAVKRFPYLFVGWLWYAITLLPVIGIVQIGGGHSMADRYTYIPLIGIFIMLVWGIPSLIKSENMRRKIVFPAGIAVLGILTVLTWQQCGYWQNSIKLFNHALRITKNNYFAHSAFGLALFDEGKIEEAIEHYNKALSITPDYAGVYSNRGNAYAKLGQYQRAINDYNETIRLKPDYSPVYINRGIAYAKLGQYQQAIADYNETIRLKPDYVEAYNGKGNAYTKLGRYQLAIEEYNKAIRLNHRYIKAYNNRGVAYAELGQQQRAIADYNEAISLKPDYVEAYFNRGNAYYELGQYQQALENYNEAIRLKPNYVQAYNNRGNTYLIQGNNKLGCPDAQKACELGNCKILESVKVRGFCRTVFY
jgi:tetratricopeptide (TPR) repeat protein